PSPWSRPADGSVSNDLFGLCLDVTGTATADGSKIQLWNCTGASDQEWSLSSGGRRANGVSFRCAGTSRDRPGAASCCGSVRRNFRSVRTGSLGARRAV
ncbi:ricin-type beta-trefoil lectin domain protein, partial [Streptomyces sp. MNU76]|uniref:ricin-type beta-trefoil lectin domain protein n=1 Tax=Streptomyces sp. MNU76 TaxID=2560026 RepID=UPI001E294890